MPYYFPRCTVLMEILLQTAASAFDYRVIPKQVTVERNSLREADTVELELDYRDLPVDPRAVRSILVSVFMGDATNASDPLLENEGNLAFIGFIDEPSSSVGKNGESVKLKGRDYTCLFLDYKWNGTAIDITRPLSTLIKIFLSQVPGAADIVPVFVPGTESIILSTLLGKTKWTPQFNDDAWTALVSLLDVVGLLPVFILDQMHIKTGETFVSKYLSFHYGTEDGNVLDLNFSRDFSGERYECVEVVSFDQQARTSRSSKWPTTVPVKQHLGAKGKKGKARVITEKTSVIRFAVSGSHSNNDLQKIAKSIYEEGGTEIQGELGTKELYDLNQNSLWQTANGDAVNLNLGGPTPASFPELFPGGAARQFSTLNASAQAKDAFIKAWTSNQQYSTFYVEKARHSWSRTEGYGLSIHFINYVGEL